MGLVLALLVSAAPVTCEALWPQAWQAYVARELKGELPPFFRQFPDAVERLGKQWVLECRAFDAATRECTDGLTLERELAQTRRKLEQEKVPPAEIEHWLGRLRAEWTVLDCRQANRALDRAAEAVARELLDAGVPASDACSGEALVSGRCRCAHTRCMDLCCRAGEVCTHSGTGPAKCLTPR